MFREFSYGAIGKVMIAGLLAANCCLLLQSARGQAPGAASNPPQVSANASSQPLLDARAQLQADLQKFAAEEQRLKRLVHQNLRHCQRLHDLRDSAPTGGHRMRPIEPVSPEEDELILAAGQLRHERCVDLLLNRITYVKPGGGGGLGGIGGVGGIGGTGEAKRVSVYAALYQIGPPAAARALERLPEEADAKTREMMVSLVHAIYGKSSLDKLRDLKEDRMYASDERDARIDEAVKLITENRVRAAW